MAFKEKRTRAPAGGSIRANAPVCTSRRTVAISPDGVTDHRREFLAAQMAPAAARGLIKVARKCGCAL
ncbi:MAG: hypothetical protein NVSMB6_04190 [Burkholderiaceae bacterium]